MYRLLAEAHGCKVADALTDEISFFRQWSGEKRLPVWPRLEERGPKGRVEPARRGRRP
jgi:hypothetical protein